MKIVIDLDGTVCSLRKDGEGYEDVIVNAEAVEKIKKLKEAGHYIILQTARHMETCGSNVGLINARVGKKTLEWLDRNGIVYDEIFFGKPNADIYLDDKGKTFLGWDNIEDIEGYDDKKINIVIPMAGAGSRFVKAGYTVPKPMIEVMGKPMVKWATDSFDFLKNDYKLQFIFVVLKEHIEQYKIDEYIKSVYDNPIVIALNGITRGQAETVLKAKNYINDYNRLIIYNADTYSTYNLDEFPISDPKIEGIIPCFDSDDARYSYAHLDKYGYVDEVKKKVVISSNATNGLYYFKIGRDFVDYAEKMINQNITQNGEFYVGPVYNELIKSGKRIKICPVKENWILGTPEELNYFLDNFKDNE